MGLYDLSYWASWHIYQSAVNFIGAFFIYVFGYGIVCRMCWSFFFCRPICFFEPGPVQQQRDPAVPG